MMYAKIKAGQFDIVDALRFLAGRVELLDPAAGAAAASAPGPVALVQPTPVTGDRGDYSFAHVFYGLLDDRVAKALIAAGLDDIESVRKASDEALLAIGGVGPSTLRVLREVMG
jgi:hypothetical protein